jgi:hypothetical protein
LYLGLSYETSRFADAANFSLLVYACDPTGDSSDALRQYYAAFPEHSTHHGRGTGLGCATPEPKNLTNTATTKRSPSAI